MTKERFMFDVPKLYWPRVINPIPNRMRTDGRPFYSVTFPFEALPVELREFADPVHPRDEVEVYRPELKGVIMARMTSMIAPVIVYTDEADKPLFSSTNLPSISGPLSLIECCKVQNIDMDRLFEGVQAKVLVNTYELPPHPDRGNAVKTKIGLAGIAISYNALLKRYDEELEMDGEDL